MTEIVLQVQGSEPRCFLIEVRPPDAEDTGLVRFLVSVWALSAIDALEQARRALPHEGSLSEAVRAGEIRRVALCPLHAGNELPAAYFGPGHFAQKLCTASGCAGSYPRIGVLR